MERALMSPTNTNPAGIGPRLGAPVPGAGEPPRRSPAARASFLWIDEESGDELLVEAQGQESFFEHLEALGFVRHVGGGGDEPEGVRHSARLDVAGGGGSAARDPWQERLGA